MTLAVININDAGIQVAVDGDLVRTSPGYAVLDSGNLMLGELAIENARLLPRWMNNRFWGQLSTAPIPGGTTQIRHHADLAFAHLEDLWKPIAHEVSQVILMVPGYYSAEQLGLLLGMAKECGVPVSGIVDQSVLAASNLPLRSTVLHLDIHLHCMTLTRLSNTGSLARRSEKTILETGLSTLWDRWASIIANQFIQTNRFDPMHQALTEQQLFNKLPGWIRNLSSNSMHTFELENDGSTHSVAVSTDSLLRACTPLYPQIVQAIRSEIPAGEHASLLLSHHFEGFPGLKDSLGLIPEADLLDLNELKSIGSANLNRHQIVSDKGAVSHVTQLDTGETSKDKDTISERPATHFLWRHHAIAIGAGFKLDGDLEQGPQRSDNPVCTFYPRNGQLHLDCHEPAGINLNGSPASPSMSLSAGDVLTINNQSLTLISVSSDG